MMKLGALLGSLALAFNLAATTQGDAAAPLNQREINLGGVNLNNYCQKTFGPRFRSVLIGRTAGDWTCQRSANDRRQISVQAACAMQYNKPGIKARALNWKDPLSWRCFQTVSVPGFGGGRPPIAPPAPAPVTKGVNLNYYCQKTYGAEFKSVLVGKTAGDWTCQRFANDRRQISVRDACRLQYGASVRDAKALNWNNPQSWVCVF
jgi:hypothetical protein